MTSFFAPLGQLVGSPRRALAVLAFWIVAAGLVYTLSPSLGDVIDDDTSQFLPSESPARSALLLAEEKFPAAGVPGIVLLHRPSGVTAADRQLVQQFQADLRQADVPDLVREVLPPADLVDEDGVVRSISTVLIFELVAGIEPIAEVAEWLRDYLAEQQTDDDLVLSFTGAAAIFADLAETFSQFDFRVTLFTVILVLAILLAVYRSPVMPILALVGVGWSLFMAQFLAALVADTFGLLLNGQITALMSVLVFGAGTDYTVFMVARYREELRRHDSRWDAMRVAVTRLAPAIASSGGTTVAVLGVLLLASFGTFRGMGPILGLAIALTVVAGLTLIPALVVLAGNSIFWPIAADKATRRSRLWQRIAQLVTARPVFSLLAALVVLVVFALGNMNLRQDFDNIAGLPDGTDSKTGLEILARSGQEGASNPLRVYYELEQGSMYDHLPALAQIAIDLEARPEILTVVGPTRPFASAPQLSPAELNELFDALPTGFVDLFSAAAADSAVPPAGDLGEVFSGFGIDPSTGATLGSLAAGQRFISPDLTTARLELTLALNPVSVEAIDLVPELRQTIGDLTLQTSLAGIEPLLGGQTAVNYDSRDAVNRDTLLVVPIGYLLIFGILLLVLRSLVAAVYLTASVFVSLLSAVGLAILVFEFVLGHNGLAYQNLLWAFIFLTALGADYNILLITRVREECADKDSASACQAAVASTGGVITSAGIILAGTFAILATFPLVAIVQIGFIVSVGILIDTFLVRTVLVPGIITLLGDWNWWPKIPIRKSAIQPTAGPAPGP
jgi:RND superfamily putative drug exporter